MPKPLSDYTDAELIAVLAERKKQAIALPPKVAKPDFSKLIAAVEEGLTTAQKDGFMDEDTDHYIVEEVYKAIYGPKFYDWYNMQTFAN